MFLETMRSWTHTRWTGNWTNAIDLLQIGNTETLICLPHDTRQRTIQEGKKNPNKLESRTIEAIEYRRPCVPTPFGCR